MLNINSGNLYCSFFLTKILLFY